MSGELVRPPHLTLPPRIAQPPMRCFGQWVQLRFLGSILASGWRFSESREPVLLAHGAPLRLGGSPSVVLLKLESKTARQAKTALSENGQPGLRLALGVESPTSAESVALRSI